MKRALAATLTFAAALWLVTPAALVGRGADDVDRLVAAMRRSKRISRR